MPVNFLDLTPEAATETVTIRTAGGPAQIELTGVSLSALAEIAKRYPSFIRMMSGSGSSIDAADALPAFVSAAIGHPNSPDHEARIAKFPAGQVMKIAEAAMRVTFARDEPVPLASEPAPNGADASPATSSPQQLNS